MEKTLVNKQTRKGDSSSKGFSFGKALEERKGEEEGVNEKRERIER